MAIAQNWQQGTMPEPSGVVNQPGYSAPNLPGAFNQSGYGAANQSGTFNQSGYSSPNQPGAFNQSGYSSPNQSGTFNQSGYSSPNQSGTFNQAGYSPINQPGYGQAIYPFSPQLIAQTGKVVAERLRVSALQLNRMADPRAEAIIKANLLSGGAAGIDQGAHGDCWFEAALAALARIPAGQELIARAIIQSSPTSYVVQLRGVSQAMPVSNEELFELKTRDMASWAGIIEVAAIKGWPDLAGDHKKKLMAQTSAQPLIIMGLRVLTGQPVQCVDISRSPPWMIARMLADVTGRPLPATASTYSKKLRSFNPQVTVPSHAYTVMAFDSVNNTMILRNPWGKNSTPGNRSEYPDLPQVGQESGGVCDLGGGLIKMPLSAFMQYYHYLAWSTL